MTGLRGYLAIGAVLGLTAAATWAGNALYSAGYAACQVERAAALEKARSDAAKAAEMASRKEAERLAAEVERSRLAAELEDMANADPVVSVECFSADRVRRLQLR